jgi:hypothetical protein
MFSVLTREGKNNTLAWAVWRGVMMKVAVVFDNPIDVAVALAEIEVPEEVFRDVILDSEGERDLCSGNDAPSFPGFLAWAKKVRGLRDRLAPHDWRPNDDGNFSTVVRGDGAVSIAVATGDHRTGKRMVGDPRTKYQKGPRMLIAVEKNSDQMGIWEQDKHVILVPDVEGHSTWILLCNREGDRVYAELSLPNEIAPDGQVVGWARRIILAPIVVEPEPGKLLEDEGADFDVDVVAK